MGLDPGSFAFVPQAVQGAFAQPLVTRSLFMSPVNELSTTGSELE